MRAVVVFLEIARHIAWQRLTSRKQLALWIVYRCFPGWPFYQLIPLVNALSACVQLASIAVVGGSLATLLWTLDGGWVATGALLALIAMARLRLGAAYTAALVGCLILLPSPIVSAQARAFLALGNLLVAVSLWWELRTSWSQFYFKPMYLENVNVGSARVLRETVHLIYLFVETNGGSWSASDKKQATKQARQATHWLVQQARKYGTRLKFKHVTIRESHEWQQLIPEADAENETHRVFGEWVCDIVDQRVPRDCQTANENTCVIVFTNERLNSCTAYAVPTYQSRVSSRWEYAVIGADSDASVIAHELLHLFGADDFYLAAYWGRDYTEHPTRDELLDSCIMHSTKPELSSSLVDELTAQKVGWM